MWVMWLSLENLNLLKYLANLIFIKLCFVFRMKLNWDSYTLLIHGINAWGLKELQKWNRGVQYVYLRLHVCNGLWSF